MTPFYEKRRKFQLHILFSGEARSALACLAAIALACLLNGCETLWPPHIKELHSSEKQLRSTQEKLRRELYNRQNDLAYFDGKAHVLDREKKENDEYLFTTRSNIRTIFQEMKLELEKNIGNLYDCYIGEETILRKQVTDHLTPLLLVDLENPAFFDMTLVEGEVYCNSPATITFCTIGVLTDKPNCYEVLTIGQEFNVPEKGKYTLKFDGKYALRIKNGEYIGLFMTPGSQIYYDETGTGKTFPISLKALTRGTTFELKINEIVPEYTRAYSFRLWGFKR